MSPPRSSGKPARRFWGWGYLRDGLTEDELRGVHKLIKPLGPAGPALPEPQLADYALNPSRGKLPDSLSRRCPLRLTTASRTATARASATSPACGCAMRRTRRTGWRFPAPKPTSPTCSTGPAATTWPLLPFGGGTSVVGGVEAAVGNDYAATLSLDLEHFDQVLEVDTTSRAALIQAGILGPDLEATLRPHGLTLRHFPQSFEFSTLGGWIATRAGGHYATQYTHIDDFVESTRMVTPAGVVETRRLPASGAGPAPDRLIIGSEGTMGVITQAWMRLQSRPVFRASASVAFADVFAAAALRARTVAIGPAAQQLPPARCTGGGVRRRG